MRYLIFAVTMVGCATPKPVMTGLTPSCAPARMEETTSVVVPSNVGKNAARSIVLEPTSSPPPSAEAPPPIIALPTLLLPQFSRLAPLFPQDEDGQRLPCPKPNHGYCTYGSTTPLPLGGETFWLGSAVSSWEHDGMFGHELHALVVSASPSIQRPFRTLVLQVLKVHDSNTVLRFRRMHHADINDDGALELCIESVTETGPGLFEVMDMEEAKTRWIPYQRTRRRAAFQRDATSARIVRAPTLDKHCPPKGYTAIIARPELPTPIAYRLSLQGDNLRLQPRPLP